MIKARFVQFMLLITLGLIGCSKERPLAFVRPSPPRLPNDAEELWNWEQPPAPHLVRGNWPYREPPLGGLHYLQFEVDGRETTPYILWLSRAGVPHEKWGREISPVRDGFFDSSFLRFPSGNQGVDFSNEEIAAFENALRKAFDWHQLAVKEQLEVESRELLWLTNRQFTVFFHKRKNSAKFLLSMSLWRDSRTFSITLDQMGAEKMLAVITNLPARRESFIAFKQREAQQERDRREKEAQEKEKAAQEKTRADEILR